MSFRSSAKPYQPGIREHLLWQRCWSESGFTARGSEPASILTRERVLRLPWFSYTQSRKLAPPPIIHRVTVYVKSSIRLCITCCAPSHLIRRATGQKTSLSWCLIITPQLISPRVNPHIFGCLARTQAYLWISCWVISQIKQQGKCETGWRRTDGGVMLLLTLLRIEWRWPLGGGRRGMIEECRVDHSRQVRESTCGTILSMAVTRSRMLGGPLFIKW